MADQDFSVLLDDGKPNQISVGLVETPSHRMISYLLDPTKIGDALFCINEQDPDYLPLVGLRARRLGETYPYPAIQGYRAGNEVDVACYMQAEGKELPPPARVICYLQPAQMVPIYNTFGLLKYGVGNYGSIGFNPQGHIYWNEDEASQIAYRALSYDGQEVLTGAGLFIECDQLPRYGIGHVEFSTEVVDFDTVDVSNWAGKNDSLNSRSLVKYFADEDPVANSEFQIDVSLTPISENRLRIKHVIKNISGINLSNVFCLVYFEFFTDLDSLVDNWGVPHGAFTGVDPFFYLEPHADGVNGGRFVGVKQLTTEGLVRAGLWRDSNAFGFDNDLHVLKGMSWDVDPNHEQTESYLLFEHANLPIGESKTIECDIVVGKTFSEISE